MSLLPFLEQTSLFQQIIRPNTGSWWPDTRPLADSAATKVVAYICPTDSLQANMAITNIPDASFYRYFWGGNDYTLPSDGGGGYREYYATCYKSVLGAKWPVNGITLTNNPATNYPSAGGRFSNWQANDNGIDYGNGAFPSGRRCSRISDFTFAYLESITDGLSNTFGFGENSVYWQGSAAWVNPETIGATVAIPLNRYKLWLNDRKTFTDGSHWQESFGFSSEHPGGGQFALMDGAVRFVSETVSQTPYLAAGSIDVGESIAAP
jgi:hypothetical protein